MRPLRAVEEIVGEKDPGLPLTEESVEQVLGAIRRAPGAPTVPVPSLPTRVAGRRSGLPTSVDQGLLLGERVLFKSGPLSSV